MINVPLIIIAFFIGYFIGKKDNKSKIYAPSNAGDINKFSFETPDKSPRSSSRMQ